MTCNYCETMGFDSSSQNKNWIFTPEALEWVLRRANSLGKATQRLNAPLDEPRCFACQYSIRNGTLMQELDAKEESENSEMALDESLDAEEERILKLWNMTKVLKVSGVSSGDNNSHLRRSDKVISSACAFLQRFYLSHSVLEFDPEIVAFSALFLASKIEDEIVSIQDLVEAILGGGEEATSIEVAILAMERPLLEGIRFNLRVFSPYHPLLAFLGDLHEFGTKKENKLLVKALPKIETSARAVVDALLCTYLSFLYSPAALGLSAMLHATLSLASTWAQARNDGEGGAAESGFDFDCSAFFAVQGYTESMIAEINSILEKLRSEPELKSAYKYPERKSVIRAVMKRYKKVIPKLEDKLKRCAVWGNNSTTVPNEDGGGSVGEDARGMVAAAYLPAKRPRFGSDLRPALS